MVDGLNYMEKIEGRCTTCSLGRQCKEVIDMEGNGRLFASYVGYLLVNEHCSFHISVMEENGEGLKI